MGVEELVNESKARLEALLEPINGGVGEDVSYHELFDAMKTEIDKQTAVDGGKIDWKSVANNAEELLREKSKDFRVALNYAAGSTMSGGLTELLDGLVLLQELNARFWDTMFPPLKRPRTRGNACSWYSDTVGPAVSAMNISANERDLAMAIDQVSRAIDSDMRDKLGEAYAGMSALREQVRGLVARAPAPPPPPPPPRAAAADAPPASGGGGSASASSGASSSGSVASSASTDAGAATGPGFSPDQIVDADSANNVLGELAPLFQKAATVLFEADRTDPNAYRFRRVASWMLLTNDPPDNGGKTFFQAPNEYAVTGLAGLHDSGDWATLLQNAEETLSGLPVWLDAVRYVATALENLGEPYGRARNAVVRDLAALLARAPRLAELAFDDGTPFANDQTKAWIESTVLAGGGGGGGGGGGAAGGSPIDKATADAKKTAGEGDLPKAMTMLSRAVNTATSPAQRFKGRLELAKLCLSQGLNEIAVAQLESLEKLAEQHRLIDWEPALATDLYLNLYTVRRATTQLEDAEQRAKLNTAFERLCQLDAGQALKAFQGQ